MSDDLISALNRLQAELDQIRAEVGEIKRSQKLMFRFCFYAAMLLVGKWLGLPV